MSLYVRTKPFKYLVFFLVALYFVGSIVGIKTYEPYEDLWVSDSVHLMSGVKKGQDFGPELSAQVRLNIRTVRRQGIYYDLGVSGIDAGKVFARGVDADMQGLAVAQNCSVRNISQTDAFPFPSSSIGPKDWGFYRVYGKQLSSKDLIKPSPVPDNVVACGAFVLVPSPYNSERMAIVLGTSRDVVAILKRQRKNPFLTEIAQAEDWSRWADVNGRAFSE